MLDFLVNAVTGASTGVSNEPTAKTEMTDVMAPTSEIDADPFLFPKDGVLELLDAYGGRMWQQDVIAETGYSAGKVSELLSEMEADGQINRYWKNGKKVVTHPDQDPQSIITA